MKKIIPYIFLLVSFLSLSQDYGNKTDAMNLCSVLQTNSFSENIEAEKGLDRILSVIGASKRTFIIQPCENINNAIAHNVGNRGNNPLESTNWDGYLAEVHFIDGTALTPSSFGETGDYGEWKPKEVSGLTYGTNGFYLPFKQDYTVEGFSATTYGGTGVTQHIGGVGFQPDLVWIKRRNSTDHHKLADSVRGVQKDLHSNLSDGEYTNTDTLSAFNTDGFSVGNNSATGASGGSYVAWCWDMGGTTVTNTTGSISAQVRANSTYGQSIITYTASYSGQPSIGHGLSSAPEMIIFKSRSQSMDWHVYHKDLTDGNEGVIKLNTDAAQEGVTSDYLSVGDLWHKVLQHIQMAQSHIVLRRLDALLRQHSPGAVITLNLARLAFSR